jgi:Tol biopolymer transport system component/DNA-binding winged helix-turn-helix (wHTH) protein
MALPSPVPNRIRFDTFELDVTSGELRKSGILLKLQPQPFRVLLLLIEREGQVVTREEIKRHLWTESTFVDFEHGINFSINQIRGALADSAEHPRYVETIPKRGYRFTRTVEVAPRANKPEFYLPDGLRSVTEIKPRPSEEAKLSAPRHLPVLAMLVVCATAFAGGAAYLLLRASPAKKIQQRRLTVNPSGMPVDRAIISPDGKYLAYSDQTGMHLQLIGSNETHLLEGIPGFSSSQAVLYPAAWFPGATRLLVNSEFAGQRSIWATSILGGSPRKLRDDAVGQSVSPDGSLIAFTANAARIGDCEIWLMESGGENARKLVTLNEHSGVGRVAWSPDGKRIVYQRFSWNTEKLELSVESCDLKGTKCVTVLSDPEMIDFWLGQDGRLIYSRSEPPPNQKDSNLWEIRIDPDSAKQSAEAKRITNWAGFSFRGLTGTTDGNRLAFMKASVEFDVYVGQLERNGAGLKTPRRLTLDDHDDFPFAWTPDSKAVIFMSDRNGSIGIFRQKLDQDSADAIVTGAGEAIYPTISPDGYWLLYAITPNLSGSNLSARLIRVPLSGGAAQEILATQGYNQHDCARLPATLCVYSEKAGEEQIIFWAFDPVQGKGSELTRLRVTPSESIDWALAPDGSQIAVTKLSSGEGRIRILSLTGRPEHSVIVKGWGRFCSVNWASDGKSFFVSSKSSRTASLLHVSPDGQAQLLWQQKSGQGAVGFPSPDGRNLAITGATVDSNVWLVENF